MQNIFEEQIFFSKIDYLQMDDKKNKCDVIHKTL